MWKIVTEPKGKNPGVLKKAAGEAGVLGNDTADNIGGIIIYLVGEDGVKEELSRVAFVRRNSKNPDTPFKDQLRIEVEKAHAACEELNGLFENQGVLQ